MRRADRLFQIVQHLRGGRLLTAKQLGERLGVTERTIYRDVADLTASGVPIKGEAGVGYVLQRGFDVPPLMFTSDEVVALVAGARMLRAFGGAEMAVHADEALEKIRAVLPESARRRAGAVEIHALAMGRDRSARTHLDVIDEAIASTRLLHLGYRTEAGDRTERTVRPLGLLFWGRIWTLSAWCELREDFRAFRVDRIETLERGRRFAPDPERSFAVAIARMRPSDAERAARQWPEPLGLDTMPPAPLRTAPPDRTESGA